MDLARLPGRVRAEIMHRRLLVTESAWSPKYAVIAVGVANALWTTTGTIGSGPQAADRYGSSRQERAWMARSCSIVSACAAVLSVRYRLTRAKRSAIPPGYLVLRCTPSKATSTTWTGST